MRKLDARLQALERRAEAKEVGRVDYTVDCIRRTQDARDKLREILERRKHDPEPSPGPPVDTSKWSDPQLRLYELLGRRKRATAEALANS